MDLQLNNKLKLIKTKRRKAVTSFLLLLFIFSISCVDSRNNKNEFYFESIESKIDKVINNKNLELIDIKNLTPFEWTQLYIFRPYTPFDEINNQMGFTWDDAINSNINQDDSYDLLVFTSNKKVIRFLKWPRGKGDFSKIKRVKYSYLDAKFILKKEKFGVQDWYFFYESPR